MNKLETLIKFVNGLTNNEHSELRNCMGSLDFSKMAPYLTRIDIFEDIKKALTIFKEVIGHLKVDVDTSDHDYYDKIVKVDYELNFDSEDPEELDKATELLDWFYNEHEPVYPEDMEDEKE